MLNYNSRYVQFGLLCFNGLFLCHQLVLDLPQGTSWKLVLQWLIGIFRGDSLPLSPSLSLSSGSPILVLHSPALDLSSSFFSDGPKHRNHSVLSTSQALRCKNLSELGGRNSQPFGFHWAGGPRISLLQLLTSPAPRHASCRLCVANCCWTFLVFSLKSVLSFSILRGQPAVLSAKKPALPRAGGSLSPPVKGSLAPPGTCAPTERVTCAPSILAIRRQDMRWVTNDIRRQVWEGWEDGLGQ